MRCVAVRRITVDGMQTQFSCKLSVDPKLWDTKGERVTGRNTTVPGIAGETGDTRNRE